MERRTCIKCKKNKWESAFPSSGRVYHGSGAAVQSSPICTKCKQIAVLDSIKKTQAKTEELNKIREIKCTCHCPVHGQFTI